MSVLRELVTVPAGAGAVARYDPLTAGLQVYTSLRGDDAAARRTVFRALQGADQNSDEVINTVLEVSDVIVHPVTLTSAEGEEVEAERCVLVCAGGTTVGFCSRGIIDSLRAIYALERPAPWRPPIKLRVISRPTKAGRRILLLEPVYGAEGNGAPVDPQESPASRPSHKAVAS